MKEKKRYDIKGEAIIAASIEEFCLTGFHSSSMDAIAARANVSKRTLYNHFSSKEVLFKKVVDVMLQMSNIQLEPYDPEKSFETQLCYLAEQKINLYSKPEFLNVSRIVIAEAAIMSPLAKKMLSELNLTESEVKKWFVSAKNSAQLKNCDPGIAATQFLSLIKSFCFWPQLLMNLPVPTEAEREKIIHETVEIMTLRYL